MIKDNSDAQEPQKEAVWTPKSKTAKKQKTLTGNIQYWEKKHGVERLAFVTLTFKENLFDRREAQRRWNNLNRTIGRDGKFTVLVKVLEVQKRGAIHYHLLVLCKEDIRTGFDFEMFKRVGEARQRKDWAAVRRFTSGKGGYAKTCSSHLRHLWGYMRTKCESHKFGRSEFMPIEYPNNIGSYLGKYLNKDDEGREKKQWANAEMTKGMRRVSYGRKETKVCSANFNWVRHPKGKPLFRHQLKEWAEYRGFESYEEIKEAFGKNWSYHYYQEIMYDVPKFMRESQGLPPLWATWGRRAKDDPDWDIPSKEVQQDDHLRAKQWHDYFRPSQRKSSYQIEKRRKEAYEYKLKFPWKFDGG